MKIINTAILKEDLWLLSVKDSALTCNTLIQKHKYYVFPAIAISGLQTNHKYLPTNIHPHNNCFVV